MQASSAPPKDPQANGDEDRQFGPQKIRFIGNFHKTLPHNEFGEVKVGSYEEFRTIAADSNAPGADDFELVDRGPLSFQPHQAEPDCAGKKKEADLLVNPLAGRAKESCGPDPRSLNMLPAPEVLSDSTAAEMTELYWMALLRDVSFDLFPQAGQSDTAVGDLKQAFERALANDKADGRLRLGLDLPKGADGKLRLDAQTLFRAGLPDEDHGPLVSQFFLHDVQYGTQTIKQHQFPYRAERDYLTDHKSWLLAQNAGYDRHCLPYPNANSYFDDKQVFDDPPPGETLPRKHRIRNMRDLARFVHKDALHQAYFNAALLLLQWNAPPDPGNPYRNGTYSRQRDFATLGGPHILTLVSEVATRALKAVWRQKWLVHRRLRPEAYGGLMQMQELGYEGTKRPYGLPDWVFGSQAAQVVRNKHGTYFLPMAFTSGSPPHPAYGAGHATGSGALATMLKAFFDETKSIENPLMSSLDGLSLVAYTGADAAQMTVGGELNKLAGNVALFRNAAGVHWRTDYTDSLPLGEAVAIRMLQEMSLGFNEDDAFFELTRFDGQRIRIFDGKVMPAL